MDPRAVLLFAGPIALAYFIGAVPFSIVVAKFSGGPDPRSVGSGRTGGANASRALGARLGFLAGGLDVAKGVVAVGIPILVGANDVAVVLSALAAIIGHSRSPYIGFGGGRGVSVGFGGLLAASWPAAAVALPVFLVVFLATRVSSLGSLASSAVAGVATALLTYLNGGPPSYYFYAVAGAGLIWLFHADNIRRLLAGQERRFDARR